MQRFSQQKIASAGLERKSNFRKILCIFYICSDRTGYNKSGFHKNIITNLKLFIICHSFKADGKIINIFYLYYVELLKIDCAKYTSSG